MALCDQALKITIVVLSCCSLLCAGTKGAQTVASSTSIVQFVSITGIAPIAFSRAGNVVTISGGGFISGMVVRIGSATAPTASPISVTASTIVVNVPEARTDGLVTGAQTLYLTDVSGFTVYATAAVTLQDYSGITPVPNLYALTLRAADAPNYYTMCIYVQPLDSSILFVNVELCCEYRTDRSYPIRRSMHQNQHLTKYCNYNI